MWHLDREGTRGMADRLLLMDSDIFVLLAGAGLLDRAITALGFSVEKVRRLAALPHQLRKGRSFRQRFPGPIRSLALAECQRVAAIENRPDDDDALARLIAIDDIDEGEALLLALTAESDVCYLASGDKRALVALATRDAVQKIRQAVAGRIISLEIVLEALVEAEGAANVGPALASIRAANTTINVLFGHQTDFDQQDRLRAIASYRDDLIRQVGEDFLYTP